MIQTVYLQFQEMDVQINVNLNLVGTVILLDRPALLLVGTIKLFLLNHVIIAVEALILVVMLLVTSSQALIVIQMP